MPDEALQPCAYHVVRYQPNLIRDEWVNIGVLLFIPGDGPGDWPGDGAGDGSVDGPADGPGKGHGEEPGKGPRKRLVAGRVRQRWLEEPADLARLRRLHPAVDEELLLRLPAEFDRQLTGAGGEAVALIEKFDQTLSNAVQ